MTLKIITATGTIYS